MDLSVSNVQNIFTEGRLNLCSISTKHSFYLSPPLFHSPKNANHTNILPDPPTTLLSLPFITNKIACSATGSLWEETQQQKTSRMETHAGQKSNLLGAVQLEWVCERDRNVTAPGDQRRNRPQNEGRVYTGLGRLYLSEHLSSCSIGYFAHSAPYDGGGVIGTILRGKMD